MLRKKLAVLIVAAGAGGAFAQNQKGEPAKVGSSSTREKPAGAPTAQQTESESPAALMQRNGGSLLRATLQSQAANPTQSAIKLISPFAVPEPQPKTIKKHDLVTIIVREESEASSEGTADLKRESSIDAEVANFIELNLKNLEIQEAITGASPKISATGNRSFKGEATVDRTDSMIARVTAEVVDVKPNGTMVLAARKKIKHEDEEQLFMLSGTVRVEDITPDNTVLSTQLADMEFSKTTKGMVRSTTKRGLIGKLLDFLNVF